MCVQTSKGDRATKNKTFSPHDIFKCYLPDEYFSKGCLTLMIGTIFLQLSTYVSIGEGGGKGGRPCYVLSQDPSKTYFQRFHRIHPPLNFCPVLTYGFQQEKNKNKVLWFAPLSPPTAWPLHRETPCIWQNSIVASISYWLHAYTFVYFCCFVYIVHTRLECR